MPVESSKRAKILRFKGGPGSHDRICRVTLMDSFVISTPKFAAGSSSMKIGQSG